MKVRKQRKKYIFPRNCTATAEFASTIWLNQILKYGRQLYEYTYLLLVRTAINLYYNAVL